MCRLWESRSLRFPSYKSQKRAIITNKTAHKSASAPSSVMSLPKRSSLSNKKRASLCADLCSPKSRDYAGASFVPRAASIGKIDRSLRFPPQLKRNIAYRRWNRSLIDSAQQHLAVIHATDVSIQQRAARKRIDQPIAYLPRKKKYIYIRPAIFRRRTRATTREYNGAYVPRRLWIDFILRGLRKLLVQTWYAWYVH